MRPLTLFSTLPLLGIGLSSPDLNTPCGSDIGDCPSPLTCIPLSQNCTVWDSVFRDGPACRGTCQDLDVAKQKVYTLCGGWSRMDDCNEAVEKCVADPRHAGGCGPACDGPGICVPYESVCGWDTGESCGEGMECFFVSFGCLEGMIFYKNSYADSWAITYLGRRRCLDKWNPWQAKGVSGVGSGGRDASKAV